jgi:hypothetical protein
MDENRRGSGREPEPAPLGFLSSTGLHSPVRCQMRWQLSALLHIAIKLAAIVPDGTKAIVVAKVDCQIMRFLVQRPKIPAFALSPT